MSKYGHLSHDWFEAVINKIGGEEAAKSFLRGELTISAPVRLWREEDGAICFPATSNGMTGKEWIKRFESKGIKIGDYAKYLLLSRDFKPSKKGTVHQVAVLKGSLFSDNDRTTANIRQEADKRKLGKLNAEVACLIRDMFTDKEIEAMGLYWIVTMHEPIKDSDGYPDLLGTSGYDSGSWLRACYDYPDNGWSRGDGFAFSRK